jgi:succinate dehydrogenase hydrophobic anchor subunit
MASLLNVFTTISKEAIQEQATNIKTFVFKLTTSVLLLTHLFTGLQQILSLMSRKGKGNQKKREDNKRYIDKKGERRKA